VIIIVWRRTISVLKTGYKSSVTIIKRELQTLLFNNTLTFAKNSYTSGVDVITLIYHIDRFDEIYNLIRREKPLQAVIDDKTLNGNVSTLQLEPVGELDV
jgi:calcineurin-like phosphoesterase